MTNQQRPAKARRLSAKVVCDIVRRTAEKAGSEKQIVPKTLRHSYATHLMNRNVDFAIIASLMAPIASGDRIYLHVLGAECLLEDVLAENCPESRSAFGLTGQPHKVCVGYAKATLMKLSG